MKKLLIFYDGREEMFKISLMIEYGGDLPRREAEYRAKREVFYSFVTKNYPQIVSSFEATISKLLEV